MVKTFPSFPSSSLGTPLPAKLSLATIFVPKYNLGTSGTNLAKIFID